MRPVLSVLLNAEYSTSRLVDLGRVSEDVGYHGLWYTDLRFAHDCFIGLAAIAPKTSRILLGPGVVDPYSRHPSAIASAIATLDEMTGGRAILGLGVGGQGLRQLGIEHKLPVAAMREAVEMIRGLLGGAEYSAQGKVISLSPAKLSVEPAQKRADLFRHARSPGHQAGRGGGRRRADREHAEPDGLRLLREAARGGRWRGSSRRSSSP